MQKNITLEQSLQAYRVMNTPARLSWKQHWAQEAFSNKDLLLCDKMERKQFSKRLLECNVTICDNIRAKQGTASTLYDVMQLVINPSNKNVNKNDRKVVYSTNDGTRPIGEEGFLSWNGFQVIDMDIKNEEIAKKLKHHIFEKLNKCNWFLGVALSSSGMGLHIYTKIAIPEADVDDLQKKKLLYYTNFRHKYSFVYLVCISAAEELGYSKDSLIDWIDIMMCKPQQGVFITYDQHPLINTSFFEDFIYVSFDNIEDIGHPDIDWVTHPDLKEVFKRWEWFAESKEDLSVSITNRDDVKKIGLDKIHTKVHYKHNERWRLANTLVNVFGKDDGYHYLRAICSNATKDKELKADCITASRHEKPVDIWAVNRLNSVHGFNIKLDIQDESFNEEEIFNSMNSISNPTIIKEADHSMTFNIDSNQYLGDIKYELLEHCGLVTLLEAGAGVGKTEMVKSLVNEGKKCIMVMPFTSTIKSKVENDPNWSFSYGNRKPRLDAEHGLSMTIDKFAALNLMDIKASGFDYIFIDESHLLFQSEYRPIMPKVIEMIKHTEVPIVLMSGTPSGELVFFPNAIHLKVIKKDLRKKEFHVNLVDSTPHLMFHMCRQMANDIMSGKRILFPTNSGTLYSKQIKAAVTFFMQHEHANFEEVRLQYYKKSNLGEKFMDDVNFEKTIKDTQILLCTNYLSVGVDILDKFNFSVYFADLMMPQEVEQFANRLRSNDLYIHLYVAKNDAEGNSRCLHKYKGMNFKMNDEEIKTVHSILRLCNAAIERNPIEYRYNSLISSIIHDNKYIEYDELNNKYYLNEIAFKVIYFERKYREYVQQLPVLMKGMEAYGYEIFSRDLKDFKTDGIESFMDLKNMVKLAYDDQLELNTKHIEELLELITEDNLNTYKEVMKGSFEIRKGDDWVVNLTNRTMTVKNVEIFEKVIPIYISLSKQYTVDSIKEIFYYCKNKNGSFNFAAIGRIRTLVNIIYNDKNKRLDLPIKDFMIKAYKFSELGTVYKSELAKFISDVAKKYAEDESTREILILNSLTTVNDIIDKFDKIFRCLVNVSRPKKDGKVTMERVELLWKEREYYNSSDLNENVYILNDFLDCMGEIEHEVIEEGVEEENVTF